MEEKKEKRKWEKIPENERDLPRWKQTRRKQEVKEYLKNATVMKTIRWSKSHCEDIINWWNAQESPVHSLTKIIRAEIAEHGTCDYFESRGIEDDLVVSKASMGVKAKAAEKKAKAAAKEGGKE